MHVANILNYRKKENIKTIHETEKRLYEISNTYKQTMIYHSGFNMEYYYGGIRWLNKYTAKAMKVSMPTAFFPSKP